MGQSLRLSITYHQARFFSGVSIGRRHSASFSPVLSFGFSPQVNKSILLMTRILPRVDCSSGDDVKEERGHEESVHSRPAGGTSG